jgi:pimeloyl-ACP methyl ester carboxylesterase
MGGCVARSATVRTDSLHGGLPCLVVGSGPPLIYLRGFTTTHTNPTGPTRFFEVRLLRPYRDAFTVYSINRPAGLAAGVTMAEVAHQHAGALAERFEGPVPVVGVSSGGSVALQLAADQPALVSRLVLLACGCRLSEEARAAQSAYLAAVEEHRRGAHHLARLKVTSPVTGWLAAGLAWVLDPLLRPRDPSDMLRFGHAEINFDLTERLADITSPTLIIGGDADRVYGPGIFRMTADGVRDGRLVLYPGVGHGTTLSHRKLGQDVLAFLAEPAV